MSAGFAWLRLSPRAALVAALCAASGLALALAAWPAAKRPPAQAIAIPGAVLAAAQPGDLVFRRGTDLVSDSVRLVDGGRYSHVGMLVRSAQGWQVIHAVPAEAPGRTDTVTIDSLAAFAATERARAIGIAHVDAGPAARAKAVARVRAQLGRPFGFDAGQIYCTTLITAAWEQAGVPLAARSTRLHIPLMDGDYVLPSAVLQSPRVQLVWASAAATPESHRTAAIPVRL